MKDRAIIYTRVSSDSQIDNTSLDEQERIGKEFCKSKGWEVLKVFREEGVTAKITQRPELQSSLTFCNDPKNNVEYFVVYKLDRFSRNTENHFMIKALLARTGVKLISMTENLEDTPSGRLMETILAGFAQFDNEVRTERTINGIRAKLKKGEWFWDPPVGYIKIKGRIVPDQCFDLVQDAWQMASTGYYKLSELRDWLNSKGVQTHSGIPISTNTIYKMFRNRFYSGLIYSPKFGILTEGIHKPMVTQDEFYKVGYIYKKKNDHIRNKHFTFNPFFTLNKSVRCPHCGKFVSGSWSKQKYKYGYYRCVNPNCDKRLQVKKETLEDSYMLYLHKVKPTDESLDFFKRAVVDLLENEADKEQIVSINIGDTIQKLEKQIQNTKLGVVQGIFSAEEGQGIIDKRKIQLAGLKTQYSDVNIKRYKTEIKVNLVISLIKNFDKLYRMLDSQGRWLMSNWLFPHGVIYENANYRTVEINKLFTVIDSVSSGAILRSDLKDIPLQLFEIFKQTNDFFIKLFKLYGSNVLLKKIYS